MYSATHEKPAPNCQEIVTPKMKAQTKRSIWDWSAFQLMRRAAAMHARTEDLSIVLGLMCLTMNMEASLAGVV